MPEGLRPLPRYKCHKEVSALKIARVDLEGDANRDTGAMITPADGRYAPFRVDNIFLYKHRPQAGGYYVVYKDGYASFSPADAFEEGYSLV